MRLLLNILWAVFGGGLLIALQHLKLAVLALFPFGRRVIDAT